MFETGTIEIIDGFEEIFRETVARAQPCLPAPGLLGVRVGMLAARLFGLDLPQRRQATVRLRRDRRGCFTDGVAAATGCTLGRSHNASLVDYGKVAVTFVDTVTDKAVRVWPNLEARQGAWKYAPRRRETAGTPNRKATKQCQPASCSSSSLCNFSSTMKDIVSKPGLRAICSNCGEEIMNEREVVREGAVLCKRCAGLDTTITRRLTIIKSILTMGCFLTPLLRFAPPN